MTKEIKIPFGVDMYRAKIKPICYNTSLTQEQKYKAIQEAFSEILLNGLKGLGYSNNKIGRLIFEEALDWYAKINMPKITAHYLRLGKIPKFFVIKLDNDSRTYNE